MKASGYDIITRIEAILTDKNLKKRALADYAGVSLQLLRDWKNRKNVPPADILFTMAEFLDVPIVYLLTGETETGIPQEVLDMAYEIMALDFNDQKEMQVMLNVKKEKYIKQESAKNSDVS